MALPLVRKQLVVDALGRLGDGGSELKFLSDKHPTIKLGGEEFLPLRVNYRNPAGMGIHVERVSRPSNQFWGRHFLTAEDLRLLDHVRFTTSLRDSLSVGRQLIAARFFGQPREKTLPPVKGYRPKARGRRS